MVGIDDLETVNPELIKEWNYEKNDKLPSQYLPKSGKKVWWKCQKCGHEYHANGSDIFQKKCPNCQGGIDTGK